MCSTGLKIIINNNNKNKIKLAELMNTEKVNQLPYLIQAKVDCHTSITTSKSLRQRNKTLNFYLSPIFCNEGCSKTITINHNSCYNYFHSTITSSAIFHTQFTCACTDWLSLGGNDWNNRLKKIHFLGGVYYKVY